MTNQAQESSMNTCDLMQRSSPSLRKMIDQLLQASRPHNCSPLGFSVNPWHLAPGDCEGEQTATISWISPFPAGENCHLVDRYQKSLYTCVYIYICIYIGSKTWALRYGTGKQLSNTRYFVLLPRGFFKQAANLRRNIPPVRSTSP